MTAFWGVSNHPHFTKEETETQKKSVTSWRHTARAATGTQGFWRHVPRSLHHISVSHPHNKYRRVTLPQATDSSIWSVPDPTPGALHILTHLILSTMSGFGNHVILILEMWSEGSERLSNLLKVTQSIIMIPASFLTWNHLHATAQHGRMTQVMLLLILYVTINTYVGRVIE